MAAKFSDDRSNLSREEKEGGKICRTGSVREPSGELILIDEETHRREFFCGQKGNLANWQRSSAVMC